MTSFFSPTHPLFSYMQHFLHNIPLHSIIHFLSFISSTTAPYTSLIYFLHNNPLYTSLIYFLHNSPLHNIIHFLWFISSTTLFTTSFIYFLHNSPLHNITYLFPPQEPTTQYNLFPVIYFPPQHYSQHHLHKLFISLRSIIYTLHIIFFPCTTSFFSL